MQEQTKAIFRDTYTRIEADMLEIVRKVQSAPPDVRIGTAHIDRMAALAQYAFYVALVRRWLTKEDATILDWGGQHGQVTRLLSRFYSNTVCYVLINDAYDREYGLADWHQRLGINRVIRASDPRRINLEDCSFDAVISSGVLEHVCECGVSEFEALSELHRILKPDGLLFIWNLPRQFGRESIYPILRRAAHQRRFRKKEVLELLRCSGFAISYLAEHELLPLAVLKRLETMVSPYKLVRWDYAASERLGFLAQNFTLVARRQ